MLIDCLEGIELQLACVLTTPPWPFVNISVQAMIC